MTKKDQLSPFWMVAAKAAEEVETWPAWKRMETVYRTETAKARGRPRSFDREAAHARYVSSNISVRDLARELGVNADYLRSVLRKRGALAERRQAQAQRETLVSVDGNIDGVILHASPSVVVLLRDGTQLFVPIRSQTADMRRLTRAPYEAVREVRVSEDGKIVHWPYLDISIGLDKLKTFAEVVSPPPGTASSPSTKLDNPKPAALRNAASFVVFVALPAALGVAMFYLLFFVLYTALHYVL